MPLVTPGRTPGPALLDRAHARWQQLLTAHPELEPAVSLQRTVLGIVAELSETLGRGRLPRLSLPARYLAAKLGRGVPALAGEPIPLPLGALTPVLLRVCDTLADGGAGVRGQELGAALASGAIDAGALLGSTLAREQDTVRALASRAGVAADLLWLAADVTAGPFAHRLQESIFGRPDTALDEALRGWNHGYCPACGSWPVAAEVTGGHRVPRCGFCSAGWELLTYACVYCGEAGEAFVTAAPDRERTDRRLEACRSCAGYMKTIDVDELSPYPLVAITDLETMDLDVAAMQHNYRRPAVRSFQRR